jgi:hypothetical protein
MAHIEIEGLQDAKEVTYPGRAELEVLSSNVQDYVNQSGNPGTRWNIQAIIVDHEDEEAIDKKIFTTLYFPQMTQKDGGKYCKVLIRKACESFGISAQDGFDPDEAVGAEFAAILTTEEDQNGSLRTAIKTFLPRPVEGE